MSHYYAEFSPSSCVPGGFVRHDTRVYLNHGVYKQCAGTAVAAIIAKNPGAARPASVAGGWGPIPIGNDKLPPSILSIFTKAYITRGKVPPEDGYVQVLNLSYFCTPKLPVLKSHLKAGLSFPLCPKESATFPVLWFAWGGPNRILDPLKARFRGLFAPHHVFFDQHARAVVHTAPSPTAFARHTQGLKHCLFVPQLATLL